MYINVSIVSPSQFKFDKVDVPFCTCSITQDAVAQAFEEAPSHDYYQSLIGIRAKSSDIETLKPLTLFQICIKKRETI